MAREIRTLFTPFWTKTAILVALFVLFALNFTVLARYRASNQCDPRNATYHVYIDGDASVQQLKALVDASVEASGPEKKFLFRTCSGKKIDIGRDCQRPPAELPVVDTSARSRAELTQALSPVNKTEVHIPLLVIVVPSYAGGRKGRDDLRKSWWNFAPNDTKMFFTVGNITGTAAEKSIMEEIKQYGDLYILPDVDDGYYGLSRKVLKSIAFASQNFPGHFLMKADDDTWVDVPAMLKVLRTRQKKRFYFGFLMDTAPVQVNGRWAEKGWPWYFGDKFLPYMLGGGYVLSYDLADYIYHAEPLLNVYTAEDITVGAALANLDIYREKSYSFKTYISHYDKCIEWPLVDHKIPGPAMVEMYNNYLKYGRSCKNMTHEQEEVLKEQAKLEKEAMKFLKEVKGNEEFRPEDDTESATESPTEATNVNNKKEAPDTSGTSESSESSTTPSTSLDELNEKQAEEPKPANPQEKAAKRAWQAQPKKWAK